MYNLHLDIPGDVQFLLALGLQLVVFVNRRVVLSLSDPFPIEIAMLLSGFWINNMSDMARTLSPSLLLLWHFFFVS